ncbi:MAG TPA: succinyl-diaminopimelate desuccinylase [Rhodanobacteraceae bacterium]|nr:succinyl-diaminopimelate desuccinylase [Rhodanobacteraceae bacterium]
MSEVLDLTCELILRRSLTPDDAGCMVLLASRLERAGFRCEHLGFGEVSNLWATHGQGGPVLAFLGHVDVVPSGPETDWTSPPFKPTLRDGKLYGRGAADMKSGVAAMVVALEQFVAAHPDHAGTVALLLTSDEEGPTNLDGVRRVAQHFRDTDQRIDWCLVGEPTAKEELGDLIRVGRRGSLSGVLTVRGVQGHVAYPQLARNPIHLFAPALAELAGEVWDEGNDDFPPTSFQVSNVNAGTGAYNVVPGLLVAHFNFRFGTASTATSLRERTEAILKRHALDYAIDWNLSGDPFHSPEGGHLRETVIAVCRELCGIEPEASTGGGTSDGRFIAPLGAEVVEIGPVNASIHKVDECIAIGDLERLPAIHLQIMRRLLAPSR